MSNMMHMQREQNRHVHKLSLYDVFLWGKLKHEEIQNREVKYKLNRVVKNCAYDFSLSNRASSCRWNVNVVICAEKQPKFQITQIKSKIASSSLVHVKNLQNRQVRVSCRHLSVLISNWATRICTLQLREWVKISDLSS